MYNPLPYLPKKLQGFIRSLQSRKVHNKIIFIALGLFATIWFLIRVIPKPSRAGYPCMQATAPFMSGFVLYLLSLGGAAMTLKSFRTNLLKSKYITAVLFLILALSFYFFSQTQIQLPGFARNVKGTQNYFTPNDPIGVAQGIFPGRVVWMWDPKATNENCDNTSNENGVIDEGDNAWFMEINNNQQVIDSMLIKSLLSLTGATDNPTAWDMIFHYYNNQNGYGDVGYTDGQKILLKINATSAYGGLGNNKYYADLSRNDDLSINDYAAETNPFLVLSMLHQLVEEAGVPEEMIYLGDPCRNIYKEHYDLWHADYPDVKYLGNNLLHPELEIENLGRHPVSVTDEDKVFHSDNGTVMEDAITDKLFTIFDSIDYLINIPTMKAHATAGITLAAKNHFGSFTRAWAMHLHTGLMEGSDDPQRLGYGLYRIQTDIMHHKLLSGKNLLMIVDGLYPSDDALGVPYKWTSIPFEGDWCSSIFMSLDPVAIESVCHDFLRTEYNGPTIPESRPNWHGVDDYLHQAADSALWPEDITYDPDNDGILISSLGVHEHWNDSLNKKYTRNLGIGEGIELIKVHELSVGIEPSIEKLNISVYPNPVVDNLKLVNPSTEKVDFQIINLSGQTLSRGFLQGFSTVEVDFSTLPSGTYLIQFKSDLDNQSIKIIKQ